MSLTQLEIEYRNDLIECSNLVQNRSCGYGSVEGFQVSYAVVRNYFQNCTQNRPVYDDAEKIRDWKSYHVDS